MSLEGRQSTNAAKAVWYFSQYTVSHTSVGLFLKILYRIVSILKIWDS